MWVDESTTVSLQLLQFLSVKLIELVIYLNRQFDRVCTQQKQRQTEYTDSIHNTPISSTHTKNNFRWYLAYL